eukprot:689337_1
MNSKVLISKEEFCCILLLFITLLLFADGTTRPISTSSVIHLQFVTKNDMDNTLGALASNISNIYGSADGITRSIPARHVIHLQFVTKNDMDNTIGALASNISQYLWLCRWYYAFN